MTRTAQNRLITAVIVAIVIFLLFAMSACGSDGDPAPEYQPPTTEPVSAENSVNIPNDNDLIVVCWNGFRVFTTRSTYYGGQSVAAVVDSRCVTP